MSSSTPYAIATRNSVTGTGSDAVWSFAQRVNADIATNLNNLVQTEIPVDGVLTTNQTGFAVNGNGIQLTGADSWVRASFNIHAGSVANRSNLIVRLALDTVLIGPVAAHGYIRDSNGHQESSYAIGGHWVFMTTGQTITVESLREAAAGTVTMQQAGTSQLLLERLVNV